MITLLTRREIAGTKKVIGAELTKMQQSFFDEEVLQSYKDNNEEELYWEIFDLVKNELAEYKTFHKIISIDHPNINTFTNKLTTRLIDLFQQTGSKEFYILSHLKLDLFGNRENLFPPLVGAYKQLEKLTGQTTYKEAFHIDKNDLGSLVEILFWITRCDPSAPEYIFLLDTNEKISLSLCKYGNIHLTEFGEERLTGKLLNDSGWRIIEGYETDNFSDGKIEGRKLKV